ncbi:MAG: hypothetical protein ACKV0T_26540 [Planctomycetales bacterium]
MLRRFGSCLLLVAVLTGPRQVAQAAEAWDAFSTDAGVVVRIRKPEETIEKVATLVDQVVPGAGAQVRLQADGIGIMVSNPTLAGANKKADWWLAVYPRPAGEEPEVVYVIPATDLKAMQEAVGSNAKFQEFESFGVYTSDADAAELTAGRLKGTSKSISTLVEKPSLAVFDKGDVSVFINVRRLSTVYKAQIEEARDNVSQGIESIPSEIPNAPGMNPKAIAEEFGELFNMLLQGLSETQSCTIALAISKEGLVFEDLVRVDSGSATDKFLQKAAPGALAGLGMLPVGGLGYVGMQGNLSEMAQFGLKITSNMLGDTDAAKEMQKALAEMKDLKFGAVVSTFNLGNFDEGAIRSITVSEVSEPAKVRSLSERLAKAMASIEQGGMKQSYELKKDAEKLGNHSVDVMTMTMAMGDLGDPTATAMVERLMKGMYGPDGMVSRTVYLKDKVVQAAGGGKEPLTRALAALDKKADASGSSKPFQAARSRLAEKANFVGLMDLPGSISKLLEAVAESGLLPPMIPLNPEMFRSLNLQPSYLGMSVATEAQGLRVHTSVPVEQMQGMAKIVQMFIMLQQGGFPAEQDDQNQ